MSFNAGLSGLKAAGAELDVTGNNIANAATVGFKGSRVEFADVFASSALGTSATAVGTGVRLSRVAQQFTQGTISFTDNNLDLAVNGEGFFLLNKEGERLYSRAGEFSVDRDGFIVNTDGANLVGRLAMDSLSDPEGEISGLTGNLKLDTSNIPPVATSQITAEINLNSAETAPSIPFTTGFTPEAPPPMGTYNNSTSTTVYDSLGTAHVMTTYFVKVAPNDPVAPTNLNQWQVFVGIDGVDVTPQPSAGMPTPFTLVFDGNGSFIPNDPANPPNIIGSATLNSNASGFVNAGSLSTLNGGDLVINGIPIGVGVSDGVSSSDSDRSALAVANAITAAGVPGLNISSVNTTLDLGTYSAGATALAGNNLMINGVSIAPATATEADLRTAINAVSGATGVSVSPSGNIVLTASDGRNIQVSTDAAGVPSGANFSNFSLLAPADRVQRGVVQIQQTGPTAITISGTNPLDAGFIAGTTFANVDYATSDVPKINNWDPGTGATPQNISLNYGKLTQFGSGFTVQSMMQDGSSTGRLASVDVDSSGVILARFTNGRNRKLGQVELANFENVQGLSPQGDSYWGETHSSGTALLGLPQTSSLGSIQSGALEDANVQLTDQLVALITAQRNFQANAQTIKTSDAITQTIINIT